MVEKSFHMNEVIFRQGEQGNSFFRITEGRVGIFLHFGEADELKLAELAENEMFGEMAVIECYPRSATAAALAEGTKVTEYSSDEMVSYLREHPEHMLVLIQHLGDRLKSLTADYDDVSGVLRELEEGKDREKSGSLRDRIRKHSDRHNKNHPEDSGSTAEFFNNLKEAKHSEGYYKKVETYPAGTVICREGKAVRCMYDLHSGRVGVYSGYGTDHEVKLAELYPNSFFGEAGMLSDEPRSATVVALEDAMVEIIYEEDLEELLEKNPVKVEMIMNHMSHRLRSLTEQYQAACARVHEASLNAE